MHIIRFSFAFVRFFFFSMKTYVFFVRVVYFHICANQTVTHWTKVFQEFFLYKSEVQLYFEILQIFEKNYQYLIGYL